MEGHSWFFYNTQDAIPTVDKNFSEVFILQQGALHMAEGFGMILPF